LFENGVSVIVVKT